MDLELQQKGHQCKFSFLNHFQYTEIHYLFFYFSISYNPALQSLLLLASLPESQRNNLPWADDILNFYKVKANHHSMPETLGYEQPKVLYRQTRAQNRDFPNWKRSRDENVKRNRDYGRRYLMWRKITG